jgi:hypothetical protein
LDGGPQSTGGLGSLQKVEGGNYIINGGIRPVLYSEKFQGRMLKLDAQGDTLWSTVYGDTLNTFMAWTTHELESSNTLTLGWNRCPNDERSFIHLAKYTPQGELLFTKSIESECYHNSPAQIIPTDDGSLLISFRC